MADMSDAPAPELLDIAAELYGLPLADFTPERDARVKDLKGQRSGDPALAGQVKALKKPSTAAWVVNLLVRYETEQVEQVISVGALLREAQTGMDAAQLRELTKQRRQLTAAVTTRARGLAREHGLRVTEAVATQVEATLTAAMIDESAAQAVRSGLLISALAATGIDAVNAADAVALPDALGFEVPEVVPSPPEPLRAVPDLPDTAALDEAREALTEAEAALSGAEEQRDKATSAFKDIEARSLQVKSEIDELRRRLADLESAAADVDDELTEAEEARDFAETAVSEAAAARDSAAAEVERLGG
jgi:DNA repair exonuclease SbcCD ATPase subunit